MAGIPKRRRDQDESALDKILTRFRQAAPWYTGTCILRAHLKAWMEDERERVFFVLVHEDRGGQEQADKIEQIFDRALDFEHLFKTWWRERTSSDSVTLGR